MPDRRKYVLVLPRISLFHKEGRNRSFAIGNAKVFPNNTDGWSNSLELTRPSWLDVFRNFPSSTGDSPPVTYGTAIVADDDEWLQQHASKLVSVIYYCGPCDDRTTPAEAFQFYGFWATSNPSEGFRLDGKSVTYIESANSIQLLPPIELRGSLGNWRLDLTEEDTSELVRLLFENPYDRLVAASRHFMRANCANLFHSPFEQDFSAACACLEAAFNIPRGGYVDTLIAKLVTKYGDTPGFSR